MSFGFLNTLMLLGLAGAALPVLVHLLSRRKYDVVSWGAMQFLELGRRTRRRIRLEELLLLLLRIGLVCLLAAALARPWAKGGVFTSLSRSTPRDVAVVIDGSYSMGWEGKAVTPHAAAIQWTHELLEELGGGDTVTLLDARDRVRTLTDHPTTDFAAVREQLDALPAPSGTSSLVAAATQAARLLTSGEHLDRDIILLTDGQSLCWSPDDARAWKRFDETVRQSSVPPGVWAVDVAERESESPVNFSVDRLNLSREMTVPGFPLRIEATVRQSGGAMTRREVSFAINGQRLSEKTVSVNLAADGEANIMFEHRFDKVGSYVVSVTLEPDNLPGDNRADAAITVESGLPVLLVDGNLHRDRTQSETYFVHAALTPSQSNAPWVQASVVGTDGLTAESLDGRRVVFLANVPRLTEEQVKLLEGFVSAGGGFVVAPGDRIDAAFYNGSLCADGRGLLPARYVAIKHEQDYDLGDVNIASDSLETSWLARFRTGHGVDLTEARFAHWWRMESGFGVRSSAFGGEGRDVTSDGRLFETDGNADINNAIETHPNPEERTPKTEPAARLDTGDPFLLSRAYGDGSVVQLAAPLDSDWSTLPAKNDFVPLLHEIVFHLSSRTSGRNVTPGMPLVLHPPPGTVDAETVEFLTPDGRTLPAELFGIGPDLRIRCSETDLPGIYRAQLATGAVAPPEYFVVHTDRRESDLTPLSPPERDRISENDRVRFVSSLDEIVAGMAEDEAPTELWRLLLFAVLAILVAEVLLTRRLVQGGHEALE